MRHPDRRRTTWGEGQIGASSPPSSACRRRPYARRGSSGCAAAGCAGFLPPRRGRNGGGFVSLARPSPFRSGQGGETSGAKTAPRPWLFGGPWPVSVLPILTGPDNTHCAFVAPTAHLFSCQSGGPWPELHRLVVLLAVLNRPVFPIFTDGLCSLVCACHRIPPWRESPALPPPSCSAHPDSHACAFHSVRNRCPRRTAHVFGCQRRVSPRQASRAPESARAGHPPALRPRLRRCRCRS